MSRRATRASFTRRVTTTFIAFAAVVTGLFAAGVVTAIEGYRENVFERNALDAVDLAMLSLARDPSPQTVREVTEEAAARGRFEVAVVEQDRTVVSTEDLSSAVVPAGVRDQVLGGGRGTGLTQRSGVSYLVVGEPLDADTSVYFFFSRAQLLQSIEDFRTVLLVGFVVTLALAAVFGGWVARQALRPLTEAAEASRELAAGRLGTRLPSAESDDLAVLAGSFNAMADALEQKINELNEAAARERRLVADIAHDLRTPLAAMVSGVALLVEDLAALPDGARRTAHLVLSDLDRLQSLVEDLLELARHDAGQERAHREVLRARDALDAVVVPFDRTAVEVDVPDELLFVGDRVRFRSVLSNLINNGLAHGRPPVHVSAASEGECAVFRVVDNGDGIPESDLGLVFERFYSGDRARGSGSGLGLAIAAKNAALQGGSLEAGNRPGKGAVFTLRLPLAGQPADTAASSATKASSNPSAPDGVAST